MSKEAIYSAEIARQNATRALAEAVSAAFPLGSQAEYQTGYSFLPGSAWVQVEIKGIQDTKLFVIDPITKNFWSVDARSHRIRRRSEVKP